MEGKIFLLTYEDDRDISRRKWIVYKDKDDHLLWFYNPIHGLRVESVPLASIKRMEERNLADLLFYGKDKGLNPDEIQNKISEVLEMIEVKKRA